MQKYLQSNDKTLLFALSVVTLVCLSLSCSYVDKKNDISVLLSYITIVVYYIYTYANHKYNIHMQITGRLYCSGANGFINFWFWPIAIRGERHNAYYANHPQRAVHLVMFKISVSRDPKNPSTSSKAQILHSTDSFQNPQILRTISSGHDVIHTPVPFPVWCLLWQWWLSYPLRARM